MSWTEHRKKVFEAMECGSMAIVYSGIPSHANEDDYLEFVVNSQFYYLTGLEREGMGLILVKTEDLNSEILFIEEPNDFMERWTGKMPKKAEVTEVSGIETVSYTDSMRSTIHRYMDRAGITNLYMDTARNSMDDLPDYNLVKANEMKELYPGAKMNDLRIVCSKLRCKKDAEEIADMRKAINITRQGLEEVMRRLQPGMMEYQVQAIFEGTCRYLGAKSMAFQTIAGSGINGCMMHYVENSHPVKDDGLILLDLGAKYNNYASDITRTYPVSGKFSERQKQYYELVLSANKAVAAAAKPGMTIKDLQDITCKVLGEGLVAMGKISDVSEVRKYYMHGVSHSLGIDTHDINIGKTVLEPGWVITNEPGLYIDEEEIGIRIEDDLLITEDGCEVLSADIIKEVADIEAFMQK